MLSRIFWILLAGVALVAGAMVQGDLIFDWLGDEPVERASDARIEARVEKAVGERFDGMQVVGSDGRTIDVAPQTKRELGSAVRELVAAETEVALLRVRESEGAAVDEARSRREAARAEVERLKAQIEHEKALSEKDREAVRDQIRQEVRETIRKAVRS